MQSPPLLTFARPEDGLAAEMALLGDVASGAGQAAFLWHASTPGLVLPERFTRDARFQTAAKALASKGWPVTPRRTGGGITPQGPGVLNMALAFRVAAGQARTVHQSYGAICAPLQVGLRALGIEAEAMPVEGSFCDGDYNLAVDGRKIVGTAQRWRGQVCLCHALLLTDIALSPAVEAVQRLSDGLDHGTRFETGKHCRVADFSDASTNQIAAALWAPLEQRGYSQWSPTDLSA